jgi:phospholipase C
MNRLKLGLVLVGALGLTTILTGCGSSGAPSVSGGASFTLSSSPSSLSISEDGQGTSTITVTPQNGFSGSVSLVASGLPSGVTASFNPASATISSTLTLTSTPTASTGTSTVTITGTSGASTSSTTVSLTVQSGQIKHVVIILQENRSPDNLFHDPVLMSRGADIATTGKTSTGATVTLTPVSLVVPYDLGHTHGSFLSACDYQAPPANTCLMDGADTVECGPNCPGDAAYQYVQASDVQPYFTMAETYAFGDRMFQTNEGPSFPAHQYILGGTSRVAETSTISVADNPGGDQRPDGTSWAGCLAPPGSFVNGIDISNPNPETPLTQINYPLCFEHPTLTDLLDTAGLSWKYYAPMPGSIWTAPDAIQHMCQPFSADGKFDDTVCNGPDWTATNPNVVMEGSKAQIITDISNGQFAAMNWVIPTSANSDHAGNSTDNGPSWVASIVNAIGQSPFWADTVIIVSWDDWGGWYDHQPPPSIRDSYEYGFRVPIIVISPYAKAQYVSHQVNDFGSILRFVEEAFSLQQIDPSVGYADSYALGDLSDFFNFSQAPLTFTAIQAPIGAAHFVNDDSPPGAPDND